MQSRAPAAPDNVLARAHDGAAQRAAGVDALIETSRRLISALILWRFSREWGLLVAGSATRREENLLWAH